MQVGTSNTLGAVLKVTATLSAVKESLKRQRTAVKTLHYDLHDMSTEVEATMQVRGRRDHIHVHSCACIRTT